MYSHTLLCLKSLNGLHGGGAWPGSVAVAKPLYNCPDRLPDRVSQREIVSLLTKIIGQFSHSGLAMHFICPIEQSFIEMFCVL